MADQSSFQIKAELTPFIERQPPSNLAMPQALKSTIATQGEINPALLKAIVLALLGNDNNLFARVTQSGFLNDEKIIVEAARSEPDLAGFLASLYIEKASSQVSIWDDVHKRMAIAVEGQGRGNNVQKLNAALDTYQTLYDTGKYYGKIVELTQSSGVGKSFTMAQMLKRKLGINICFREIDNITDNGWPRQDGPICKFFRDHRSGVYMGEELAAAFLGGLFHVMHTQIAQAGGTNVIEAFNSYWKFGNDEQSPRHNSLEQVSKKARMLLAEYDRNSLADPMPTKTNGAASRSWYETIFKHLVEPHLEHLVAINTNHPHIIISLDECTELDKLGYQDCKSRYLPQPTISLLSMRRIMKACDGYPCWFFLLDTLPRLLPPPGIITPSHCLSPDYPPLPVWPYFDFDVMVEGEFDRGNPTPYDALALEHLKCYGRPYWSIQNESELLGIATLKLFGGEDYNASDPNHVFAALSARAAIKLAHDPASDTIAVTAVQRHMRILESADRSSILQSSAPSEPILAVVAAHAMNGVEAYRTTIELLVDELVLNSRVVDHGSLGDLLCRLYLLMARDAVLVTYSLSVLDEYSVRTISLVDFFKTLLPSTSHDDLPTDLDEYVINFTHFASITKTIEYLTPNFLFRTWCRGAAIQCAFPQPLFDNLFIAYRKAYLSEPFDYRHCFIVVIQDKIRQEASPPDLIDSTTIPLVKPAEGSLSKLPHLVMLMDLGTASLFREGSRVQIKNQPANSPTRTSSGYYSADEPSRISINLRGHTGDTYPFVRKLGPALLEKRLWDVIPGVSGKFPEQHDGLVKQMDPLSQTLAEHEQLADGAVAEASQA